MTKLSVNVNKIALLRNTRSIGIPSVVRAAEICLAAGAHGITVHPRPDQRHIRTSDVYDLKKVLDASASEIEFNMEGNPLGGGFMELVRQIKPDQCTLVPDDPDQATSDHGWDCIRDGDKLEPVIAELHGLGIRVSLFMDPEPDQIKVASELGADRVELYTEPYATAHREGDFGEVLESYVRAGTLAHELGMGINAGHDLNQKNLGAFCAAVPNVLEVSIGHALIAEALEDGLESTVHSYLAILSGATAQK